MNEKHYPFHCGTQYMDWEENNCCQCQKNSEPDKMPTCPIQHALVSAMFDDGSVTEEIAERMGFLDSKPPRQEGFSYCWRCKEFDDASKPSVIRPLVGQMELPIVPAEDPGAAS